MSRLLAWREAGHEDRSSLQGFTCTVPAQPVFGQKRKYHPRPWEQEVQSGIRGLRPPVGQDQSLLVGEDGEGIAAVCLLADQGDFLHRRAGFALRRITETGLEEWAMVLELA